ncbi:hypothetical protein [uncultured Serinicoccus sp.]|uniref:sunset domain-containing protein n=1 Tax=uncultured Serinicoccus sp. TaxID=735514 RepID=UPI002638B775|nr:hypothetical protein [uncultured Serinicoccus sp.]
MDSTTWILLILLLVLVGIVVFWLLRRPGDDGDGAGALDARDHDELAGGEDHGETGPAPLAEPVGGTEVHQQPAGTEDVRAGAEDGQVAPTESRYDAQPVEPVVEDTSAPVLDEQDSSHGQPQAPVVDEQDGSLEEAYQPVDDQDVADEHEEAYQPVDEEDIADEPAVVEEGGAPREAEAPEFTDPAAAQEPSTEPLTADEVLASQDTPGAEEYPVGDDATTYRAEEGQAVVLDDDGSVREDRGSATDVYPGGDGSVSPLTDEPPVEDEPSAQDDAWDGTDTARAAGTAGAAGAASPGEDQHREDLWESPDTAPADAPVADDTWSAPEASTTETTVADERHDDTWVTPDSAPTEAVGTDQRQDETWGTPDTAPTDVPPTEPTGEAPVVEEPVVQEPVVEEPVAQEPVVQEPVVEAPVVEEPVAEEPVAEEHPTEAPLADEPPSEAEVGAAVFAESIYGSGSAEPLEDGTGPAGWSVKGNTGSMLFHTPDSPSYEGVRAEVWFESEDAARAAGFAHWDRRRR